LHRFDELMRRGASWLALIGFAGLVVLASMTTMDALLRSFFSAPIQGVNDVSAVVMAVVIASCIPANLAERKNISVEVLGGVLGVRPNRWLRLLSSLVVLIFIAVMAWQFVPFTQGLHDSNRRTWVLAWTVWPWWGAATVFLVYATVIQLSNVVHDVMDLVRGTDAGLRPSPKVSTLPGEEHR